jgi:hypothetical protein
MKTQQIAENQIAWTLTTSEVDQLGHACGALTAALDFIGAGDANLHRLLEPHIEALNCINQSLCDRAERLRETERSAA